MFAVTLRTRSSRDWMKSAMMLAKLPGATVSSDLRLAASPPVINDAGTLPDLLAESVRRFSDKPALMFKQAGAYHSVTYRELSEKVSALARTFLEIGVQPGDRIAIMSENRPEWAVADFAALSAGAAVTAIYLTLTPPQIRYILEDSESVLLIVSDEKLLQKILSIRDQLPRLRRIALMDPPSPEAKALGVESFDDWVERGSASPVSEDDLKRRRDAIQPDDLASLIYTSGTTGDPKGARLTHDNFRSNAKSSAKALPVSDRDVFLSFLPLCHVFERLGGHYLPLSLGATIAYSEGLFSIQRNMEETHPTIMLSVPRLYSSLEQRIMDAVAKARPLQRRFFLWGLKVGRARNFGKLEGRFNPLLEIKYALVDHFALADLREKLGGRLRYFVSGGAPLSMSSAEFFYSVGVTILEGYGLTETSPIISVNRPHSLKFGTVGPPIPGVEIQIAEDGEILSRGPHIMNGYHNKPEETAKAIDPDGWFHTGDIGRLDERGRLSITDRKKDIIVLANGKNVAPQPIENAIKASPYIADIALIGDRRNVITALVVPAFGAAKRYAEEHGLDAQDNESLSRHPEIRKLIKGEIDRLSVAFADFERVRRFALLSHEWTIENEMLTPTLKIRRRAIAESYASLIAEMNGSDE